MEVVAKVKRTFDRNIVKTNEEEAAVPTRGSDDRREKKEEGLRRHLYSISPAYLFRTLCSQRLLDSCRSSSLTISLTIRRPIRLMVS